MSYEEYAARKGEFPVPYTFTIKGSSQALFYFGERHSYERDDEQWAQVKAFWKEFLAATEGKTRIVFVEGGKRSSEPTEIEAIDKHGGLGLITYLATQSSIETYSPEPEERDERAFIESQGYTREEIQYYYFVRVVFQWNRKPNPRPDFETYMRRYLEADARNSGWSDFDFSLAHMEKIHEKLFKTPFNREDTKWLETVSISSGTTTRINEVSRLCFRMRDQNATSEMERHWKQGLSIFIEYGWSHAIIQEPLLREVLV